MFSRLDGSSSRRLGIVGGRWYRERRVCIYRLRAASDMRRLRHIKALLRSFVPGGGADGAQDAQECRGHVVHLTLNHVKSPATFALPLVLSKRVRSSFRSCSYPL